MNEKEQKNEKVFDDTYKTLINAYPDFLIPLINDQFGEHYAYDEEIININRDSNTKNGNIEADSVFRICDKFYHIECQSNPDGICGKFSLKLAM